MIELQDTNLERSTAAADDALRQMRGTMLLL